MKEPLGSASRGLVILSILWATLLFTGCRTESPIYEPLPAGIPPPPVKKNPAHDIGKQDDFVIGDYVFVSFSSPSDSTQVILPPHREAIKADGTITPPLVGSVAAAGKTPGELQRELHEKYKRFYNNLLVTVISGDRYYYVTGEVRNPGPEPYLGPTDIVKAIASAKDFTDFANKKNVRLTRAATGRTEIINVQKIIQGAADTVPVYPGDTILVKRRIW